MYRSDAIFKALSAKLLCCSKLAAPHANAATDLRLLYQGGVPLPACFGCLPSACGGPTCCFSCNRCCKLCCVCRCWTTFCVSDVRAASVSCCLLVRLWRDICSRRLKLVVPHKRQHTAVTAFDCWSSLNADC